MTLNFTARKSRRAVNCGALLGAGGEGEVYETNVDGLVAKIYHPTKRPSAEMINKLLYMTANTPEQPPSKNNHIAITWPRDLLEKNGVAHGFLMDASKGCAIDNAISPLARKKVMPGVTWQHNLVMAYNLSWVMANIHAKGFVIGDVNTQNIRVLPEGLISIIDIDSFQIADDVRDKVYPCTVMTPDFAAPELTAEIMRRGWRQPSQDCFSLAIINYSLLMCGNHPYSGVYGGAGEPPERSAAIQRGDSVFNPKGAFKLRPASPGLEILPASLRSLFVRAFVDGSVDPSRRPTAREWIDALGAVVNGAMTKTCSSSNLHVYSKHLNSCPWCELWNRIKVDYYDPRRKSPATTPNRAKVYASGSAGLHAASNRARVHAAAGGAKPHAGAAPARWNTGTHSAVAPTGGASFQQAYGAPSATITRSPAQSGQSWVRTMAVSAAPVGVIGYVLRGAVALAAAALFVWLNYYPPVRYGMMGERGSVTQNVLTLIRSRGKSGLGVSWPDWVARGRSSWWTAGSKTGASYFSPLSSQPVGAATPYIVPTQEQPLYSGEDIEVIVPTF